MKSEVLICVTASFVSAGFAETWPAMPQYSNQNEITNAQILYANQGYDWRPFCTNGPYVRGGDYCNWSAATPDWSGSQSAKLDENGVIYYSYDGGITFTFSPTIAAQYTLWLWSEYRHSGVLPPQFLPNACNITNWENSDGSLRYQFDYVQYGQDIGTSWASSLGQGECASALIRAYKLTGNPNFLNCASNAIHFMLSPAPTQLGGYGGCAGSLLSIDPSLGGYPFFNEYPFTNNPYILDGSICGLIGFWDWCEYEPALLPTFYQYLRTIEHILPYYDANGFSWYDLQTLSIGIAEPAMANYHMINTMWVWQLDSICPSPVFNRTWHTWANFVNQPLTNAPSSVGAGLAAENWPAMPQYGNQDEIAAAQALYSASGYDWRPFVSNGPYLRGGDYMNWSRATTSWAASAPQSTFDSNGDILFSYDGGVTYIFSPTITAQYSLWLWSDYLHGNGLDPKWISNVSNITNCMGTDGSMRYPFSFSAYGMDVGTGWVSSQGQGECASALVRAYRLTGDPNFLNCASNAVHYMLYPEELGGCAGNLGNIDPSLTNYPFFVDCPFSTSPYILDGSLSGLLGLWDWCEYEPDLLPVFYQYLETIKYILPYYDANGFSWYDLQTLSLNIAEPAQPNFHMLNTALIWTFDSIAPSPVFNRTWHTWAGFVNQPLVPALPVEVEAQFYYATNDGMVTITGYTGPGGPLTISSTVGGLPVAGIGDFAFYGCYGLTSITIPNSVTNIGNSAFGACSSLRSMYFRGNAPSFGANVFTGDNKAVAYYLPGTTGWSGTLGGLPTVLWNPQVQTSDAGFGVQTNQFGFDITGTANIVVVVEATTNLVNPVWSPLATNTLTGGSSYFSDPQWTNYPSRFYRLSMP